MAMFVVIQIALFSLVIAQNPSGASNSPNGWWFKITPEYNPPRPTMTPCLLSSEPVIRRDDYTYTPGIGGHKVHTRALTWNDARRTCEEEGGHLAIINSAAEANAVTEIFQKAGAVCGADGNTDFAHIGFHDMYQEGEYVTIHGQSLARAGFSNWAPGQPDNRYDGENCGSVRKNGGLNDIRCGAKYAFICEIPIY